MKTQPILELVNINAYYGASHVLHNVSLKVEAGSVATLLGRLGAGKTTTLCSIVGIGPRVTGTIRFAGREIAGLDPHKISRMGLALVPQGRRIFPSLSVKENLTMAARLRGKIGAWTLDKVYSLFPILKERANFKGNLLSGGEQQMLAIGRALMTNPDLILMDEPSEGLAPLIVLELGRIIKKLAQSGITILLVEQILPLAFSVANDAYMINKGTIVYEGSAEHLKNDKEMQAKYLGVSK